MFKSVFKTIPNIGLLFKHKNTRFRRVQFCEGAKLRCAALRGSLNWRVTYRIGVHTGELFMSLRKAIRYRVLKCDVIKNWICEIMGFVKIFWKKHIYEAFLPKTSIVEQIVSEILAQLCSDDSIQILRNLTLFLTLGTESNLEGFVWSHQSL